MNCLIAGDPFLNQPGQLIVMLQLLEGVAGHLAVLHIQQPLRSPVQKRDLTFCINHYDAARHIIQHALQEVFVVTYRLELGLQAVGHSINGGCKLPDFIPAVHWNSGIIVQICNPPGYPCNLLKRRGHAGGNLVAYKGSCNEQQHQSARHDHPGPVQALGDRVQSHGKTDITIEALIGNNGTGYIQHLAVKRVTVPDRTADPLFCCQHFLLAGGMVVHLQRIFLGVTDDLAVLSNKSNP
ncbi:hypothetical protein D3C73_559220 [compost metagenome]